VTGLTWAEFQLIMIIERLRSGDPEPLIKFMRKDGDMSKFDSWQLDVIESVLRGEDPKGRGRPKSDPNRNTNLLFEIAWYAMKGFPLSDPKANKTRGKLTAFDKASEAINNKVGPERAKRLWDEADNREFFRRAVRD
jgi:hypothetical protein